MSAADIESEFRRELELLRSDGLKTNPLRREYETAVHELKAYGDALAADGADESVIARELHARRRALGAEYKKAAPPLFRDYIYWATAQKYGDPLGPDYVQLCRHKTAREIIESAARPIEDLDDRLTVKGFIQWFNAGHPSVL